VFKILVFKAPMKVFWPLHSVVAVNLLFNKFKRAQSFIRDNFYKNRIF